MPPLVRSQILSEITLIKGMLSDCLFNRSNLFGCQLHDMTPPKCSYTRPNKKIPLLPSRIYWTRQHQRLSLYINQEGTIQIFKYRKKKTRYWLHVSWRPIAWELMILRLKRLGHLLTKPTRSFPPKNTSIFPIFTLSLEEPTCHSQLEHWRG